MKGVYIMPRRGDNIRKRKDGRWEARFVIEDCTGTTKKYRSVYGKTYQEVKDKRAKAIYEGCHILPSQVPRFSDVLSAWQDANRVRLKEASISRYQNLIDAHILPGLGLLPVNQLSSTTINRFLAAKLDNGRKDGKGGLSTNYVRSISLIISSAIGFGASEGMCPPLLSPIKTPSPSKKELCVLSAEVQNRLELELLDNIQEDKLLIYIALYTGLRIGEVCALRWEDVELNSKVIFVRKTVSRSWVYENGAKHSVLSATPPKTPSSFRCIPICSKLFKIIENYPYRKTNGYISTNTAQEFISPRTFEYRYKRVLKSAGITSVNFHALRHTFATRCIERGVDVKTLSEILGHANAAITLNTYVHSSLELKRLQLEKIA